MVFATLAPSVSHALATVTGASDWVEVCTAQGSRWVAVTGADDAAPATPSDGAAAPFDHCPFCHLGGQGMAPPPAPVTLRQPPALRDGPPDRSLTAAHTAHAWRAAQPRAPPLLC